VTTVDLREYKEGYRDALAVGARIAQTVADDNGTAGDVVKLMTVLAESHVLDHTGDMPVPHRQTQQHLNGDHP
jgi:hypothetical protein